MKVFIIAAQTVDGFIAKDEHHGAFWTSKEDKKRFVELTKKAGVVVMGSTTFKTLPRPLQERINIVYTRSNEEIPGAITTSLPPLELISKLESEGHKEVAICGGASIYDLFMHSGAVTHLYLTIEPLLFGQGVTLFKEGLNTPLELVSEEKTEHGTLLLEYKVVNKLV